MALPHSATGSLSPGFPSARLVCLTVKPPYAFALNSWFPSSLRRPLDASVTLWEATAPVKLPTRRCPRRFVRLGDKLRKSGISRLAPPPPRWGFQSLPPILRILGPTPAPSCSKAPRGLFVLWRVARIFTGIAISPSPSLRQCPARDTFRAGRNLPDKEFRYLRTVIVTAAVHRGFGSRLITPPLNLPALGRCQPLYLGFPLSRDLCFC